MRLGIAAEISRSVGSPLLPGRALARLEAQVALQTLLERYPRLHLAGERELRPKSVLRGPRHLPAALA